MRKLLFIRLGTIKSWSDSKATMNRLADICRVDERRAAMACTVADDEETYRFMYPLVWINPGHYHWLRNIRE